MIVRIITCKVKPGDEAEFEELTTANHTGSVAEAGVLRFDVLRDTASSGTYYLYEVYRDQEATEAHKTTTHYLEWREAVADLMSETRTSVACTVVAPVSESDW
jgi:autoinducer 2-degrading protein